MEGKLAENIRALRKEKRMTQEQLAECLDVTGRSGFQVGERRDHAGSIDDYGAGAFFCGIGGCLAGISVAEQLA